VAYPFAAVGFDAAGGAEQVLSMIDEALVAEGHCSIVIACRGSACAGALAATPWDDTTLDESSRAERYEHLRRHVERVAREAGAHVVHLHGLDFARYLPASDVPVLATLHLPLSFYPLQALAPSRARTWLNGVSESQMAAAPAGVPHWPVVANGVRVDRFRPLPGARRRYAIAVGRICPEKGIDLALDAARSARTPMLVLGRTFPYEDHVRYFLEAIAPRLGPGRYLLGRVGPDRKRALLARARCLLVTSRVDETSSLVAMEALACGTPVLAFRVGALPSIIEDGVTGLLVDDVDAMARAIPLASALDAEKCRRAAEQRFSAARMTARYLRLYEHLASGAAPGEAACSA
jgi:glycosyltransferase involved in cell wall biosynthesis